MRAARAVRVRLSPSPLPRATAQARVPAVVARHALPGIAVSAARASHGGREWKLRDFMGAGSVLAMVAAVSAARQESAMEAATMRVSVPRPRLRKQAETRGRSMVTHLWEWVRPELPWLVAGAALAVGAAALSVLAPGAVGRLQDSAASGSSPVPALVTLGGLVLGRFALEYGASTVITASCQNVADRMRMELFSQLLRSDIAFFDASSTGQLAKHLDSDVKQVRDAIRDVASKGVRAAATTVGGLATLLWLSPTLTGGLVVLLAPLVLAGNLFGAHMRRLASASSDASAAAAGVASESLANVRVVRAFNAEPAEQRRYGDALKVASDRSRDVAQAVSFFAGGATLALNAVTGAVLAGGSALVAAGAMTQGQVGTFLVHTLGLSGSLEAVSLQVNGTNKALGAATRLSNMLDAKPTANAPGGAQPGPLEGDIEWRGVGFAYPSRPSAKVLDDLSLSVKRGSTLALVGGSGAGKSTAGQLLLRFYDPDAGAVLVDGHDLRDVDPRWYRESVAVVPQHPLLFAASVLDNVLYGKPDATRAQVENALREAQCDFVFDLPEGLDTVLSEGGGSLSGGQKQRLSLARALVRDPRILLLDEATAALDAESEGKVQAALERACQARRRTVVVIAHRLSTVRMADSIAVLQRGRVVEQGTHAELLRRGGAYASLVQKQRGADHASLE